MTGAYLAACGVEGKSPRTVQAYRVPAAAMRQTEDFVAAGGSLFTTDWALLPVIEEAFPDVIVCNGLQAKDDVVRVEVSDHEHPFLDGVMDATDEPVWWLEAAAYSITIICHDRFAG